MGERSPIGGRVRTSGRAGARAELLDQPVPPIAPGPSATVAVDRTTAGRLVPTSEQHLEPIRPFPDTVTNTNSKAKPKVRERCETQRQPPLIACKRHPEIGPPMPLKHQPPVRDRFWSTMAIAGSAPIGRATGRK